jgi:hypothetical protein
MSNPGTSVERPTTLAFLTPQAFDNARAGSVIRLEPNPDAITRIGEITGSVSTEFALPAIAQSLAIVILGAVNHPNQPWATLATMFDAGHSPFTNFRKRQAVAQVRDEKLKPFTIQRKPWDLNITRRLGRPL